jgi:hypothetical protein
VKTSPYCSTMHVFTWSVGFSTNQAPTYRRRSDVLHAAQTYRHVTSTPLDPKRRPRNALQMTTIANCLWHSAKGCSSWTTLQTVYNDMCISGTSVQMLVSYSTTAIPSTMSIVEHISVTPAPYTYAHNIT